MRKIICRYYMTDMGRVPVQEFADELDARSQRKFFSVVELLEAFGKDVHFPPAE